MTFKKGASIALVSLLCGSTAYAGAYSMPSKDIHYRASFAAGPRFLNGEVMDNTGVDAAMELGFGVYKDCHTQACYYGIEGFANNAWDARFDSLNGADPTQVIPAFIHNSSSMEVLAFLGKDMGAWQAEIGGGAQFSWIKWLGTAQVAEDRLRVLPKLRVSVNRKMTDNANFFVAFSQAFNPYGSFACTSGVQNCVNDEGFVSVSDVKLGFSIVV